MSALPPKADIAKLCRYVCSLLNGILGNLPCKFGGQYGLIA